MCDNKEKGLSKDMTNKAEVYEFKCVNKIQGNSIVCAADSEANDGTMNSFEEIGCEGGPPNGLKPSVSEPNGFSSGTEFLDYSWDR